MRKPKKEYRDRFKLHCISCGLTKKLIGNEKSHKSNHFITRDMFNSKRVENTT